MCVKWIEATVAMYAHVLGGVGDSFVNDPLSAGFYVFYNMSH